MNTEILIVDDNTDIRNIINELIIDAGYKTRIAANFNQALTEIDKKLPDVAILDVKLDKGDNDGIELLSHIKTKDKAYLGIVLSHNPKTHNITFADIQPKFKEHKVLDFFCFLKLY